MTANSPDDAPIRMSDESSLDAAGITFADPLWEIGPDRGGRRHIGAIVVFNDGQIMIVPCVGVDAGQRADLVEQALKARELDPGTDHNFREIPGKGWGTSIFQLTG